MLELIRDPLRMKSAFPIFQFHNSLGVLVFAITLARIALRLRRKAPSLLAGMPGWERLTAFVAQATFYLLLVIIPVTGWLYISTEWAESLDKEFKAPTLLFGQFAIPYASAIAEAEAGVRRTLSLHLSGAHAWLTYGLFALIVLHSAAAAAFKHYLVNKDNVLSHVIPAAVRHQSGSETDSPQFMSGLTSSKVWLIAGLIVCRVGSAWRDAKPSPATSYNCRSSTVSGEIASVSVCRWKPRQRLADRGRDVGTHNEDQCQARLVVYDVAKEKVLEVQPRKGLGGNRYPDPGCRKACGRDEIGGSLDGRKWRSSSLGNASDDVDQANLLMELGHDYPMRGDIVRAQRGKSGQGMIWSQRDHDALFMDGSREDSLRVSRSRPDDANVDLAFMYGGYLLRRFKRNRLHFNFREAPAKQADQVRQHARHDCGEYIADPDRAGSSSAELATKPLGSIKRRNSVACFGKEEFTRAGQGNLVPLAALYEARSDLVFETFEPLAHDRLGNAKSIGRPHEMFKFGNGDEGAQGIRIEHPL